jgi:hypothetical protein
VEKREEAKLFFEGEGRRGAPGGGKEFTAETAEVHGENGEWWRQGA